MYLMSDFDTKKPHTPEEWKQFLFKEPTIPAADGWEHEPSHNSRGNWQPRGGRRRRS